MTSKLARVTSKLARLGFYGACLTLGGCHTSPPRTPSPSESRLPTERLAAPKPVDAPRFLARAITESERGPKQKAELASAVRYVLTRAARLYERGAEQKAARLVRGALLLLRQDDAVDDALSEAGETLLMTAHQAAQTGDSGQAQALYLLSRGRIVPEVASDVTAHLEALQGFDKAVQSGDPLLRAGDDARRQLLAALVDPGAGAYRQARERTVEWLQKAINDDPLASAPETPQARDHAIEAFRAQRGGAPALISLALRQGEPTMALDVLDQAGLGDAVPRGLERVLKQASRGSSERYVELYHLLDNARRAEDGEVGLPRPLLDGAVFWASILAARSGDGTMDSVLPLAVSLVEFEMGEVAAHILGRATSSELSREAVSFCLTLGLRAILDHSEAGEVDAAERTYQELTPLLELSRGPRFARVEPSQATLGRALAEAELEAGRLARARPRLEAAVRAEPSAEGNIRLATVLSKLGETNGALGALGEAVKLSQSRGDLLLEAVAETETYLLWRTQNQRDRGRPHLGRALARLLTARSLELSIVSTSALERQLAQVLEYYGDDAGRRRAYQRALEASRNIPLELKRTLTDMARSALVERDLPLAREATHQAVELGLAKEDVIYIALWQMLLERELGVESDGMPSQVLASSSSVRGWPYQLRQWALGRLAAEALVAKNLIERTERAFYAAMEKRGEERARLLREVAKGPTVSLVEATIARDLLRRDEHEPLPDGILIP